MGQGRHDPVRRLNDHHADDLLAVARAFCGYPDATSARVEHVGPAGIDLVISAPHGTANAHVDFTESVPADRLRIAFRALTQEARAVLAAEKGETGTP